MQTKKIEDIQSGREAARNIFLFLLAAVAAVVAVKLLVA